MHASSGIRTQAPSAWAVEDSSCLISRGHCDPIKTTRCPSYSEHKKTALLFWFPKEILLARSPLVFLTCILLSSNLSLILFLFGQLCFILPPPPRTGCLRPELQSCHLVDRLHFIPKQSMDLALRTCCITWQALLPKSLNSLSWCWWGFSAPNCKPTNPKSSARS